MSLSLRRFRRLALLSLLPALALASACGPTTSVHPDVIPGTYAATTFRVTPANSSTVDVLAQGGSLTITVDESFQVAGSIYLPGGLLTTDPINANLAGKVQQDRDGTWFFTLTPSTFMNGLVWTQFTNSFVSTTKLEDGTQFQVLLEK